MTTNTITITKALYDIFNACNDAFYSGQLPEPFITIIQGKTKRKSIFGSYNGQTYISGTEDEPTDKRHEIMIAGERLKGGKDDVCETMLHEMVHLYCSVNNIKDMNSNHTKHTKKYAKAAEAHGLEVDCDDKLGWAITSLNASAKAFVDSLDLDMSVFDYFRNTILPPSKPTPKKGYACPICGLFVMGKKGIRIKCAEHDDYVMDRVDMTDPGNPEILEDYNEGLAQSGEGWIGQYMEMFERMEDEG